MPTAKAANQWQPVVQFRVQAIRVCDSDPERISMASDTPLETPDTYVVSIDYMEPLN